MPSSPPLPTGATKAGTAVPSQRAVAPVVNSAALTKDGDPDWDQILASENLLAGLGQDESSQSRFQLAPETTSEATPLPSPFSPLESTVSDAPIFQQGWQSKDVAKRRQWLTLATIAVTSSLLAIGCFIAFLKAVGNSSKAEVAVVPPKTINDPPITPPAVNPSGVTPPSTPIDGQPDTKEPQTNQPSETSHGAPNPTDVATETILDPVPTPATNDPQISAPDSLPSDSSVVETSNAFPNRVGEVVPSNPPVSKGDDELDMGGEAEPIFFGMLGKILDANTPLSDAGNGNTERQEDIPIESAEVSFANAFHPSPATVPNWNERSKFKLSSFKADDTNLLKSLDLLGRIAGVGITVDWQSCRVANIDWREPLQLDEKGKSVEELLTKIVDSRGLEWRLDNEGLPFVSATVASMSAKLPKSWSVAGVFPEGFEKPACESLIKLWGLADVCKYNEGELVWDERATPIDKSNLQSSLYELARLRQLSADNAWQHPRDLVTIFSTQEWHECTKPLQNKIKLNVLVSDQRPITDLLMKAATETDLDLVIDWQNAWTHGLTPGAVSLSVLRGRTFPQVAKRYLSDYSMVLLPISNRSVLLTTEDARRKMIRVIPVQLPKNLTLDDLKRVLQTLAPLGPNDQSRYRITPIPGTEDLFYARLCSPNVEQLSDPDIIMGLSWPE